MELSTTHIVAVLDKAVLGIAIRYSMSHIVAVPSNRAWHET